MRTCGLVTAGECGSRLNAMRNVYEKKESGNRQSHGPGPMSNKELARRETPEDTLHCTVSECTGNPSSAAVTLPDCNCGSVGSRRLRMINRAVIQTFKSQSLKKEQVWETRVARKTRTRTSNSN
jgi:hypothetical protein